MLLGILSRMLAVLCTQKRCWAIGPYSSGRAIQKPSDPSPIASLGAPDRFRCYGISNRTRAPFTRHDNLAAVSGYANPAGVRL
jgi:hypothetical protein